MVLRRYDDRLEKMQQLKQDEAATLTDKWLLPGHNFNTAELPNENSKYSRPCPSAHRWQVTTKTSVKLDGWYKQTIK